MPDLIDQLGAYKGSVESAIADAETTRSGAVRDRVTEDLVLIDLMDWELEQPEPSLRTMDLKRVTRLLATVAAATLVVVGMVVIADRYRDAPVTAPIPTSPASLPAVTVASPSAIATDALSYQWSRVAHDEAVLGGDGNQRISSVAAGGPGLVAVGSVFGEKDEYSLRDAIPDDEIAAVWTSVDGSTWARVAHAEETFGVLSDHWMNSVTVGGPGLVSVGWIGWVASQNSDAAIWTSADGITWERIPHDEDLFGGVEMWGVAAGGPGLVAVGSDGPDAAVWVSKQDN